MKKTILSTICAIGLATSANATLIDFEGFASGTVITNQFAGVEFASAGGQQNLITNQPGIGFGSGFICTGLGSINCTGETTLTFSSGVSDLSFFQVGDNNVGVVAMVDVFVGGLFSATLDIFGFDTFNTPDLVDLTAFSDVTSIRLYNITDGGGLGWDNFRYTEGAVSAVPLPAGGLLLLSALGGIAALKRRNKRTA